MGQLEFCLERHKASVLPESREALGSEAYVVTSTIHTPLRL